MRKGLTAVAFVFLLILSWSEGLAATVNLTCSSEKSLDVNKKIMSPVSGQFSARVSFSGEQVGGIVVSKGGWCNPSGAFLTEWEIGFPCSFNLAGQRISYSFTFDRLSGMFEQRFFSAGKLSQIHYGQCSLKALF